jgi:hypothetical protein
MNKDFNELLYQRFAQDNWENQKAAYRLEEQEDVKVQFRPKKEISLGMFKPDPLLPGLYLAHPQTLRALRQNLFVGLDDEERLERFSFGHRCESCKEVLDMQFWLHCPYCECAIPNDVEDAFMLHIARN